MAAWRIITGCLLVLGLAGGPVSAFPIGASELEGKLLPDLAGAPNHQIRVYAFHEGSPVPIPFQVDERDPRRRWVTPEGPARRKDEQPGLLDDNDVVVFLHRDLGERGEFSTLPPARRWNEVRVGEAADPLGFAYVGRFDDPPPRSDRDDVSYDPEADRIEAVSFGAEFGAPLPQVLRLEGSPENVLQALRAEGEARFFGGLFKLRRSEDDITAKIEGWIDGPVRVIRPTKYKISLPLGFRATARVNLTFYRDHVIGHAIARVVIPPRLVPADGELTAHFDFQNTAGARLIADGEEVGSIVDGVMSPQERQVVGRKTRWAALVLPDGKSILLTLHLEGSLQTLDQRLHYHDGMAKPAFGFQLGGVDRIETGNHDLEVVVALVGNEDRRALETNAALLGSPPALHVSSVVIATAGGDPAPGDEAGSRSASGREAGP